MGFSTTCHSDKCRLRPAPTDSIITSVEGAEDGVAIFTALVRSRDKLHITGPGE